MKISKPFLMTQDDWNTPAIKMYEDMGKDTPLNALYTASKTLAEQAAWKFMEGKHPAFDLVTVLPSWIWGVSNFLLDYGSASAMS
jgi:nucleoside-diphosphate-sugar epimerase